MGYFLGNWLHLKLFSKLSAPPTASFPSPPLHFWTCCRLVATPGCPTEKTLSDSLQAKPSGLFLLSPGPSDLPAAFDAGDISLLFVTFSFLLVCVVSLFCIFLHTIIFLFVFCIGVLPLGHSLTWTLVFLNFSLTFLPQCLFSTYMIYWSSSFRFSVLASIEIIPVCISNSISQTKITVLKAAETSGDREKVCLTWTRDNKIRNSGWDQVVRGHIRRASCILSSGLKIGPREMTSLHFERIIKQPCVRWTGLDFTGCREKRGYGRNHEE